MDKYRQLADILRRPAEGRSFVAATLLSVEGETCTVSIDGLEVSDVRLHATTATPSGKVMVYPKPGTAVILAAQSNSLSNLFLVGADEAESIEITLNGQNLLAVLTRLINTLSSAQIITPQGTGQFSPSVKSALSNIGSSFKEIFR